jgi:hypothetical protein
VCYDGVKFFDSVVGFALSLVVHMVTECQLETVFYLHSFLHYSRFYVVLKYVLGCVGLYHL